LGVRDKNPASFKGFPECFFAPQSRKVHKENPDLSLEDLFVLCGFARSLSTFPHGKERKNRNGRGV